MTEIDRRRIDAAGSPSLDSTRQGSDGALHKEVSGTDSSSIVQSPQSLLLYNAYNEYFERLEQGEEIDPDAYCAQHPHLQSSLGKLLQLHSYLQEHGLSDEPHDYPAVGDSFLHFRLLHELGKGAFAKVYLAEDTVLGRRAALKLSRRAKAEAKLMGPIEHANIVLVHYIAEHKESGLTAICMPYRGSATLETVLHAVQARGAVPIDAGIVLEVAQDLPMPLDAGVGPTAPNPILQDGTYVDAIRSIGAQIADALAYLHARDICHRDLKPSNILMTPNGTPMLLDFNLSSDYQADAIPFGGTLPFMAPEILSAVGTKEQAATTAMIDAQADIYSLGVILYQLLTGKHPLGDFSLKLKTLELRDHLLARQRQGVAAACEVNPLVDRALSDLVQRCLAQKPSDRPASARAIAEALRPTPLTKPKPTAVSRGRFVAFAGVLACILLIGAATVASVFRTPSLDEQLKAGRESYRQGNYQAALTQCLTLLIADPDSADAIFLSARAKQKLAATGGKTFFDSAMTDYLASDEKKPHGRNKAGAGYCRNAAGFHAHALAYYQEALKSGYQNAEVHNNIGFCSLKLDKLPEAVASLDRAIELNPKLAMPHYNRAKVAMILALRNRSAPGVKAPPAGKQGPIQRLPMQPNRTVFDGINDIQEAIRLGETSAAVHFDAALLCAIAADTDRNRAVDAVEYLKLALQRGNPAASINHIGFKSIRREIEAAQLAKIAVTVDNAPPSFAYLDPIHD